MASARRKVRPTRVVCDKTCKLCHRRFCSSRVAGPRCAACKRLYDAAVKAARKPRLPEWLHAFVLPTLPAELVPSPLPSPLRSRQVGKQRRDAAG